MTYSAEVLADTPLGYWRLGDASGSGTMVDSSGNGRNGTYGGSPSLGVTGLLVGDANTAASFDGVDDVGTVTSAAWMNGLTAFTVEAIVKFNSAVDTSNGDAIVSRYGSAGFQWLLWRTTGNKLGLQAQIGGSFINCNSTTTPVVGTIYHVIGKWDGTNLRIQVNGTVENTVAASGSLAVSSAPIEVGRYSASGNTSPAAVFDEAAFYGANLADARGLAHYNASLTGGITVAGEAWDAPATWLDGAVDTSLIVSGESWDAPATWLDGAPISVAGTDTSNVAGARRRGGIGTVTMTVPVAPVPPGTSRSPRADKAVALPTPTMVDGRPT